MMYHGYGMGVGWNLIVFAILLPSLLLLVGIATATFRRSPRSTGRSAPDAERVLADRFARGEIDQQDYEDRLRTLRAGRR